jgi:hypothetical protein
MKASLVPYDGRELHKKIKIRAKNIKNWVCQRLPKKASNPYWIAQIFMG